MLGVRYGTGYLQGLSSVYATSPGTYSGVPGLRSVVTTPGAQKHQADAVCVLPLQSTTVQKAELATSFAGVWREGGSWCGIVTVGTAAVATAYVVPATT